MLGQAYLMNMNANRAMEKKLMAKKNMSPSGLDPNSPYKYTLNRRAEILSRNISRSPPTQLPQKKTVKKTVKKPQTTKVCTVSSKTISNQLPKSNALVSVIMISNNSRKYIYHAIYTILKQSHHNLELIIIDNNSQDGSVNYIKNLKDTRIKIYSLKEETSLANCCNLGLYLSKGDYITFQNPLYISINERLSQQLQEMSGNTISIVSEQIDEANDRMIYNYDSLMLTRKQFQTYGFFKNHLNYVLEYIKRLKKNNVDIKYVDNLYYIRYDTLVNGIANNEYKLLSLNDYPDDEVSLDKKLEFHDFEKFRL